MPRFFVVRHPELSTPLEVDRSAARFSLALAALPFSRIESPRGRTPPQGQLSRNRDLYKCPWRSCQADFSCPVRDGFPAFPGEALRGVWLPATGDKIGGTWCPVNEIFQLHPTGRRRREFLLSRPLPPHARRPCAPPRAPSRRPPDQGAAGPSGRIHCQSPPAPGSSCKISRRAAESAEKSAPLAEPSAARRLCEKILFVRGVVPRPRCSLTRMLCTPRTTTHRSEA